jgi:phosphatidate cytidylyltransferase
MGSVLILLTAGVLFLDRSLSPWYPFLLVLVLLLSVGACYELVGLLRNSTAPFVSISFVGVVLLIVANWMPHVFASQMAMGDPWMWVAGVFALTTLAVFLAEMSVFQEPGRSVVRIAVTLLVVAYLGFLPSFLVQIRWLPERALPGLALAIFVPKVGDIGAYFTGRFLGRTPLAPVLSTKKTWEGFAGGLAAAVLAAVLIGKVIFRDVFGWSEIAAIGFLLGIAGVLGDLAESLIKRDCRQKDAGQAMPGFGGVLDVVDSILFSAPVAYWCMK